MKDADKMVKIAIVYSENRYTAYEDWESVIQSISEWTEVTVEDAKILQRYITDIKQFQDIDKFPLILYKVDVVDVRLAVDEALVIVKEIAIEKERKANERKLAALKRKKKKQINDEKDRKLLYKELKKEFAPKTKE